MENDSIAFSAGEVGLLGAALTPQDAEKNEWGLMLGGKKESLITATPGNLSGKPRQSRVSGVSLGMLSKMSMQSVSWPNLK